MKCSRGFVGWQDTKVFFGESRSAALAPFQILAAVRYYAAQVYLPKEIKKTRAEELLALAETIKILNDDDALDLFKKAQ